MLVLDETTLCDYYYDMDKTHSRTSLFGVFWRASEICKRLTSSSETPSSETYTVRTMLIVTLVVVKWALRVKYLVFRNKHNRVVGFSHGCLGVKTKCVVLAELWMYCSSVPASMQPPRLKLK